jgi:hypothetical protein
MRRSPRLMIALDIVVISLISYYTAREYHPITKETQHVSITPKQKIALGLQAVPQMASQFGGLSSVSISLVSAVS